MIGFIRKRHLLTQTIPMYRLGGLKLIVAVAMAKPGTPFLTVLAKQGIL